MNSKKTLPSLPPGPIDIHAHLLPRSCYSIPSSGGYTEITSKNGELYFGSMPIAVSESAMSSAADMVADMDHHGVAVRVVSAPPYAFGVDGDPDAMADFATTCNDALLDCAAEVGDRLIPFGIVPIQNKAATAAEIRRLAGLGVLGIAIPPVVGSSTLGDPQLVDVIGEADDAGLAVLVHPMQQMRPGFNGHYLQNLVGNPVESATAIASLILGGEFERRPGLRMAFVHGAGAAPGLLGRWDHGFAERQDVSASSTKLPSSSFKESVFADALTHSCAATTLLCEVAGPDRLLLGSDYPFDMGDPDPVSTATKQGLDLTVLRANALEWLSLDGSHRESISS